MQYNDVKLNKITPGQAQRLVCASDVVLPIIPKLTKTADSNGRNRQSGIQLVQPSIWGIGIQIHGRYEVKSVLGWGSTSVLYRVIDVQGVEIFNASRQYALKMLNRSMTNDDVVRADFIQSATLAMTIQHPNIVDVHRLIDDGKDISIVMAFLEGQGLDDMLSQHPNGLCLKEALPIIFKITKAVSFLHQNGIIHGDLKPANVFVTKTDDVKILDFGNAQEAYSDCGQLMFQKPYACTPAYASVSILSGNVSSCQDEHYSLGCLYYQVLTGRHPFGYKNAIEVEQSELVPDKVPEISESQWHALLVLLGVPSGMAYCSLEEFERDFF